MTGHFIGAVAALSLVAAAASAQETALPGAAADTVVGITLDQPSNTRPRSEKFWWDDDWFDRGLLPVPVNHTVSERALTYTNPDDGTEVPAMLYRPEAEGQYPGVLFAHGRRGLDPLVRRLAVRLAARGFVVLAPDVYEARFLEPFPITHDPSAEGDMAAGVDALLAQPEVSSSKVCLVSHTRGGFYALRVAVDRGRQADAVACYVGFYPHLQDPNAPEPEQVYRYHPDVDALEIPALIFIGEYEQYQRRRSIETAVSFMKRAGRDVRLIIYPGVGRGFDFRDPSVRTFADDLATKDSNLRTADFIRAHLGASCSEC
ncbi:dienelactone hydrolase family protein [Maritimibacter sp. HL-12]|uniref:dienelactone hydrolase family protein n=1 Tax=Maritimibacter sp. HL-12 TaxID=1162418 RepID=UPI000A0EFDCE|nr:dienelactone hydrolase family protein [Maritimibacter sp. HL-12]SMH54855.1 carboxymethylenebutenolidase [Maritimibacter sp. HL-12]